MNNLTSDILELYIMVAGGALGYLLGPPLMKDLARRYFK